VRSDEDCAPRDEDSMPSDLVCGFDDEALPPHHKDLPRTNEARLPKLGPSLPNEQSMPLERLVDELRDLDRWCRRSAHRPDQ
jgi:hypothetical protein